MTSKFGRSTATASANYCGSKGGEGLKDVKRKKRKMLRQENENGNKTESLIFRVVRQEAGVLSEVNAQEKRMTSLIKGCTPR